MTARIFNVLIGTWLAVSAFAWPHNRPGFGFALVCGVLTAVLAIGTLYSKFARYLNALVAIVLVISTMTMVSSRDPTYWNNTICGVAIFVSGLIGGSGRESVRQERELYGRA